MAYRSEGKDIDESRIIQKCFVKFIRNIPLKWMITRLCVISESQRKRAYQVSILSKHSLGQGFTTFSEPRIVYCVDSLWRTTQILHEMSLGNSGQEIANESTMQQANIKPKHSIPGLQKRIILKCILANRFPISLSWIDGADTKLSGWLIGRCRWFTIFW
jgi:hypothetical protein